MIKMMMKLRDKHLKLDIIKKYFSGCKGKY